MSVSPIGSHSGKIASTGVDCLSESCVARSSGISEPASNSTSPLERSTTSAAKSARPSFAGSTETVIAWPRDIVSRMSFVSLMSAKIFPSLRMPRRCRTRSSSFWRTSAGIVSDTLPFSKTRGTAE